MALGAALGALIGGFGNSQSARTSTSNSTSTSTSRPSYSVDQTAAQGTLWQRLQSLVQGSSSPDVRALQTQSADQINQGYVGLGDRMNRFLAARGFGKSGQAGSTALKTELGRQGTLANNSANFAKIGL